MTTTAIATDHDAALRFITCGSVDGTASTLIGRLLVDSRAVLQDQLASVSRSGETDLALTDGLSAEREQGITIDVAYRYFATPARKFIIGDAPGHEQYTRNMVTAASGADAAVVLVDATKLKWQSPGLELLPQTRRHTLLPAAARARHRLRGQQAGRGGGRHPRPPTSAPPWSSSPRPRASTPGPPCRFPPQGLQRGRRQAGLVRLPRPVAAGAAGADGRDPAETTEPLPSRCSGWRSSRPLDTSQGRRVFWGRVATGSVQPGQEVTVLPSGQTARVAQVLDHVRQPATVAPPQRRHHPRPRGGRPGATGRWPRRHHPSREVSATVAWLDDEPRWSRAACPGAARHRWVKAKVKKIVHKLDVNSLAEEDADHLEPQHRARGAGAAGAAGHPAL